MVWYQLNIILEKRLWKGWWLAILIDMWKYSSLIGMGVISLLGLLKNLNDDLNLRP